MRFRETCPKGHDNASPGTRTKYGACRACATQRKRDRANDINAQRREHYRTVPGLAEETQRKARERYNANPEPVRAKMRERQHNWTSEQRERQAASRRHHFLTKEQRRRRAPEIRARINASRRARYAERMQDPQYVEERREYWRIYGHARRRKVGVPERKRPPQLAKGSCPAKPFLIWVDDWLARTDTSFSELCRRAGHGKHWSLSSIRIRPTIQRRTVMKFLTAAGEVDRFDEIYARGWKPDTRPTRGVALPRYCRSGDDCARLAGHGPNGRFCEMHGAELDRIFEQFEAERQENSRRARERSARARGVAA